MCVQIACKTRDEVQKLCRDFFDEGQDFVFVDTSSWDRKDIEIAQEIYDEYIEHGLLAKRTPILKTELDFPEEMNGNLEFSRRINVKGTDRNKPCICGSGKKIKKCCGKQ